MKQYLTLGGLLMLLILTACESTPSPTATTPAIIPITPGTPLPTSSISLAPTRLPSVAPTAALPLAARIRGRFAFNKTDRSIWVMNADGSHVLQVTQAGGGTDFDPSWSPDGKRLVFRTSRGQYRRDRTGTGTEGIFIVNADGTGERQLYPPNAQIVGGLFPDWSPTGEMIAFSSLNDKNEETTYLIHADGSGLTDLGSMAGHAEEGPEW
ncbi:MAG: hypothetical protein LC737_04965, partial [Chloroflexi bacterium]|nr:hypothetical protein [Chloroflexota bacterium]